MQYAYFVEYSVISYFASVSSMIIINNRIYKNVNSSGLNKSIKHISILCSIYSTLYSKYCFSWFIICMYYVQYSSRNILIF